MTEIQVVHHLWKMIQHKNPGAHGAGALVDAFGNRPERCSRGRALPAGSTSGGQTDGGGQLPETQAHGHSDESGHTPCQIQDCIQKKGGVHHTHVPSHLLTR